MKEKFGVDVDLTDLKVAYRETIKANQMYKENIKNNQVAMDNMEM